MIHSFLPTRNEGAAIVAVSAALMAEPMKNTVGHSDYLTSKIAQARLLAQVAEEYPDVCPLIIHPGIVETGLQKSAGWAPPAALIDQRKCVQYPDREICCADTLSLYQLICRAIS